MPFPQISTIDPGALLARTWRLDDGLCVRLRLARRSDAGGVRDLLARRGVEAGELALSRLVRADPRREVVLCATAPIGGRETVVGVGAIELGDPAEEPRTVVVDERLGGAGAAWLIDAALRELVRRRADRVA